MNKVLHHKMADGTKTSSGLWLRNPSFGFFLPCLPRRTPAPPPHTNMKVDNYKLPFPLSFGAQIFGEMVSSETADVK